MLNLLENGINDFDKADLAALVARIKQGGEMDGLARYNNGHIVTMFTPLTNLEKQMMVKFGEFEDSDFKKYELFKERIYKLIEAAIEHKSRLYLDAE